MNTFWEFATRDRGRIMPVFGWNLPLFLALWSYQEGITKLQLMNATGLKIAKWDTQTERAVEFVLGSYKHLWIFLLFAIVSNAVFLFVPRQRPGSYFRWCFLAVSASLAIWYASFGFHLSKKVLTSAQILDVTPKTCSCTEGYENPTIVFRTSGFVQQWLKA